MTNQINYINELHVIDKDLYSNSTENLRTDNSEIKDENTEKYSDHSIKGIQIDVSEIQNLQCKPISKILLVDDQEFNLNALEIMLKYKLKMNTDKICVKAASGKEAVDVIKDDLK